MYEAIGNYGEFNRYKMELGQSNDMDDLVERVVNRLNSIKPVEKIFVYIYEDGKSIGRIVDYRDIADSNPCIPMVYLNNQEFDEWIDKRKKKMSRK